MGAKLIRVAVVDDQILVRSAVAELVAHEPGLTVVGQAGNGVEALQLAKETGPDVILMDIRMPLMDGIQATSAIFREPALIESRVIILTTFEEDEYVAQALRAGASGFLGKGSDASTLMSAIRTVHQGESLLSPKATSALIKRWISPAPHDGTLHEKLQTLTAREREVLALVARGLGNGEIARFLHISPHTAKTHVARVMSKLGAHDRAQLVIVAYETGLLRPQIE